MLLFPQTVHLTIPHAVPRAMMSMRVPIPWSSMVQYSWAVFVVTIPRALVSQVIKARQRLQDFVVISCDLLLPLRINPFISSHDVPDCLSHRIRLLGLHRRGDPGYG